MKKIYNNLNIDNLIKTDWFKQFDEKQQEEIMLGLEKGLDISWYAKEDFDKNQMSVIREGLEDNLNVSIYAKPEISWEEMKKIRLDLEESKKRKTNEQNTQQFKHRKLNKNRMV